MFVHPVNILLFIVTLIFHWRSARRKNLLIVVSTYIVILIITSIFFVPELISITSVAYSTNLDAELTRRAELWEVLSIARLAVLVILAIILFTGLAKPNRLASSGV